MAYTIQEAADDIEALRGVTMRLKDKRKALEQILTNLVSVTVATMADKIPEIVDAILEDAFEKVRAKKND